MDFHHALRDHLPVAERGEELGRKERVSTEKQLTGDVL